MDKNIPSFEESAGRIAGLIRETARGEQQPSPYVVGEVEVMTETEITVNCDGLTLTKEDLYINELLLVGYRPKLVGTLIGVCECDAHTGKATTTVKPDDLSRGEVALKKGDRVILLKSSDGQDYTILAKAVRL